MQNNTQTNKLEALIKSEIKKSGPMAFSDFMAKALYHPELGYYSQKVNVFGSEGDFVTAPLLSELFSHCLAKQVMEIGHSIDGNYQVLELGAGTGKMAGDMLSILAQNQILPEHYYILEISPRLAQHQRQWIEKQHPTLINRVKWIQNLTQLPTPFNGIILGNEFLDALPVELFQVTDNKQIRRGSVVICEDQFKIYFQETKDENFLNAVHQELHLLKNDLPIGYVSEINLNAAHWIKSLNNCLNQGVILFIDYGFGRQEYYHPDRNQGTLMCHHQHKTHVDYFKNLGQQDLTAHVNFSQLNHLSQENGLQLLGYAHQASFLMALNILEAVSAPASDKQSAERSHALQILLQPHEMGELFKVIALGKQHTAPLKGFMMKNQIHLLD